MSFLAKLKDKLLGSDLDLTNPDFSKTEEESLDLVVAKIRFKTLPHNAMFPSKGMPLRIDLTDTNRLAEQRDGSFANRFYVRGWDLTGRGGRAIGGVKVSATAKNFCNRLTENKNFNLFFNQDLSKEVLIYINKIFGLQNEGSSLGNLGDGFYQYPTSEEELDYVTINGTKWCTFSAGEPGRAGTTGFATALSGHHFLLVKILTETYKRFDYHSPETNIKPASEKIKSEFMNNFFVELSESSLKEKAAVA